MFLSKVVEKYGLQPVSMQMGRHMMVSTSVSFLKLQHHIHSSFEKSIIERTIQYIKDITKWVDDYFTCKRKKNWKLKHVKIWFNLFID
jgi:putative transposase